MKKNKFDTLDPFTFITQHLVTSLKPDAIPMVCIKHKDPKTGGWAPTPLVPGTQLPAKANLYICIASCIKHDEPGSRHHNQYRATIECASQVHMFMLDDLNNNSIKQLPLVPTWVIETSPDNHQCLYVLTTPLDDIALANKISKALPAAATSDPGAKNAVRWARLPGGINGKPALKKPFATRITGANPEHTTTVEELIDAFDLTITTNNPTVQQEENTEIAPIIGTEPTGWPRYLSALLSIPADCDYDTWWGCIIAMHAWQERGLVAIQEWSQSSSKHQLTLSELQYKFDSVPYDSRDTRGNTSIISWPWLQSRAIQHGWDYNQYSLTQLNALRGELLQAGNEAGINEIIKTVRDSYFCGAELENITALVQAAFKLVGTDQNIATTRRIINEIPILDAEDEQWTFPLTDKGNVQRFDFLYSGHFHYIPETRQYIFWDSHRWNYIREIQHLVFNTIDQIPVLENRTLTDAQSKQLKKWQHSCGSNSHIRALETLCTKNLAFSKEIGDLNTQKTLIGTPTGVYDLKTHIVGINTPEHLITMHTNVDIVADSKCPRWDKFIMEIMNDDRDLATFLQKLAGYSLYGGNPNQLFIILEGHGANGKTTFVNVLQHIFGNYAATATADTLTRPAFNKSGSAAAPDIVRLYRKRLVICNEWNEGTYINESLIKVLSGGGDEISVRALYSNKTIDYVPEFVIMLATNHRPNISGMDYGIWRRLLIIPFEVNFTDAAHISKREPHLEDYLKSNEAHGIMNWLIEGHRMWQEDGIGTSVETGIPAKLIDLKDQYKLEMDNIGQFLLEQTHNIYDNDTDNTIVDYRVRSSELYRAYSNWSADNGYKSKGTKSFSQALTHRGFTKTRVGTARGFAGIRLLTPSELLELNPRSLNHDQQPTIVQ